MALASAIARRAMGKFLYARITVGGILHRGERVDVAAIVVEQRQQIDRALAIVGLAQQPEQLLGDVERTTAAIERAAGQCDRFG